MILLIDYVRVHTVHYPSAQCALPLVHSVLYPGAQCALPLIQITFFAYFILLVGVLPIFKYA